MVLKSIVPIVMGVVLTAGAAMADQYRPDDFLTLDLPKALLSPKRLGPEAHFESLPVEASSHRAVAEVHPAARLDVPRAVRAERIHVAHSVAKPKGRSMARPVATARGAARTRVAHRHSNPLDAQAMDTRIQTWPCRPGNGGICAWKQ